VVILLAGLGVAPAFADEPQGTAQALGLLRDVARAYQSAEAYQDQGRFEIEARLGTEVRTVTSPGAITFVRPNRLAIDAGDVAVVADGKTLATSVRPSRQFLVGPCPDRLGVATLTEGPLGALFLGGPVATPARMLLTLLFDVNAAETLLKEVSRVVQEPDRQENGKSFRVLILERKSGPASRWLIDPETRLLAGVELVFESDAFLAKGVSATPLSQASVGWRSGPISTEPPGLDRFDVSPPAGFTRVEAVQVPPENRAGPDQAAAHPLVGQPAPEFAFEVFDGAEATRPINKLDLQGKVVLIDFWATWCGPCLKKLPEVEALMTRYQEAKDVVIIALNIEGRGDDPEALRGKILATLKERRANLLGKGPGGLVGLDVRMALADVFQVRAIPTVVLIDPQGVVCSYWVGGGDQATVTAAIEALRAGKPLPK
jgi:thiol-disulfide isomerase/thioredoxin